MNKNDLANAVSEITGDTKSASITFINSLLDVVQEQLRTGDRVAIKGLGTFCTKPSPAREGRNPSTGATIHIPAVVKPKFSPSLELKNALRSS